MRVARDRGGDFFVSLRQGPWLSLRSLGIDAPDTIAVVEQHAAIVAAAEAADVTLGVADLDLVAPVVRPGKVLAIGLNYLGHIEEQDEKRPAYPIVFAKYTSSLTGPYDPIVVDERLTKKADYESELAVVIGSGGRWLTPKNALDAIYGYAVANDVSARDWQPIEPQYSRSKSMDTFCPIGPWVTTADEVADPHDLQVTCQVNGEPRQDSNTSRLLFDIVELLVHISAAITLEPGDVILTGTPHGVGFVMDPPQFLVPGDRVRCEVAGLGVLDNPIVGP
jgi:2-keto-4-pentenoate hydratase/2-oxohepta-3-ene-1,7-dioic acid hydratase in catechol pathway